MNNKKQIKDFWDHQADKIKYLSIEGIANLEEDKQLLSLKVKNETRKVMEYFDFHDSNNYILDLGSGTGQWSFKLSPYAKKLTAVEYSNKMLNLSIDEAKLRKINNITFKNIPAQEFISNTLFDYIFISGLLIYLTDKDLEKLLFNLSVYSHEDTNIILRDGTAIYDRYIISNKYSETLKTNYSAIYRTREEYIKFFTDNKFIPVKDEDMFDEGSKLNKWKETRLRIYKFKKNAKI